MNQVRDMQDAINAVLTMANKTAGECNKLKKQIANANIQIRTLSDILSGSQARVKTLEEEVEKLKEDPWDGI